MPSVLRFAQNLSQNFVLLHPLGAICLAFCPALFFALAKKGPIWRTHRQMVHSNRNSSRAPFLPHGKKRMDKNCRACARHLLGAMENQGMVCMINKFPMPKGDGHAHNFSVGKGALITLFEVRHQHTQEETRQQLFQAFNRLGKPVEQRIKLPKRASDDLDHFLLHRPHTSLEIMVGKNRFHIRSRGGRIFVECPDNGHHREFRSRLLDL